MSLEMISEIWDALRTHIDFNDRNDAADTLVTFLIENNYEANDIKNAFSDSMVIKALKNYAEVDFPETEEEGHDEDPYNADDWN